MNDIQKPTVLIYAYMHYKYATDALCAGLEEEGVPCKLVEHHGATAADLAFRAAQDSILHVGIGLHGSDAAMTIDGLRKGDILFETDSDWKTIGTNAAHAVKKQRFKQIDNLRKERFR